MSKKKKKYLTKEQKLIDLRWEFLRRNKKYIKDYNDFVEHRKTIKNPVKDLAYVDRTYKMFEDKYGVLVAFNPSISRQEAREYKPKKSSISERYAHDIMLFQLDMDFFSIPFLNAAAYCPKESLKKNPIAITVNLNAPKTKIKSQIEGILKEAEAIRNKNLARKDKRPRLPELKKYLELYDLKEKGWSISRLAKKYFGNDSQDSKRQVYRYYNKCKEFIYNGYRQID